MVTVDTIGKVRRAYWVQRKKIKAIARELRLSRGTVRRIVRSGETAPVYERKEQPRRSWGLSSSSSTSCSRRTWPSRSASG
jgi:hypothetical protein